MTSFLILLLLGFMLVAQYAICNTESDASVSSTHISRGAASRSNLRAPCSLGPGIESHQVVNGSGSYWPCQTYKSSPLNPPELEITTNGQELAPGLLFMTPGNFGTILATKDVAPMIMTRSGQLVWEGPVTNVTVTNLHVSTFENQPVLTYWNGFVSTGSNVGHGYGSITFLDTSYNEVLTVCPKFGLVTPDNASYPCEADVHESHVTSRGTILFVANNVTQADLSSIGGPENGWVYDWLVYEMEPRTGKILFRWSALEHVPINATKIPLATGGQNQSVPFNYFLINSVADVGETYLISARHTFTVYLVDNKKGDIIWSINGETGGDFGPLPPDGHFSWQHHAQVHNVTETSMVLTILNNDGSAFTNITKPSNGLVFHLPLPPSKSNPATLLSIIADPSSSTPIKTNSQGSHSILPNGNHIIGYGQIPVYREYGPAEGINKNVRWQARFGKDNLVQNYRLFKQEWNATPTSTKPSLFVETAADKHACRAAYVSWNGATNIKAWKVYEGEREGALEYVGSVRSKGFETKFIVGSPVVQVSAVLADGKEHRSEIFVA